MPWFARRGHPQLLAGYYDSKPERIREWLADAEAVPNVTGVMYTTWERRYDDLEAFARRPGDTDSPEGPVRVVECT